MSYNPQPIDVSCSCYTAQPIFACASTLHIPQLDTGTYIIFIQDKFGNIERFNATSDGSGVDIAIDNKYNAYAGTFTLQAFSTLDEDTPVTFTFNGNEYNCIIFYAENVSPIQSTTSIK